MASDFSRILALLAALTLTVAGCSGSEFFRQYGSEEDVYLALDGSATVYVNTSVAALDALRGASFETAPNARIDRDEVRAWFTTPITRVTRTPSVSRRSGRRFVHVRLDVDDIKHLSDAAPFSWSSYAFNSEGDLYVYRQTVGAGAGKPVGDVGWNGGEMVAFRLHLPSTVVYHNAGADNLKRGNILVWQQTLADRLRGEPLALDARIESQSILSRTLLLFGATLLVVALCFLVLIWWVVRRPRTGASAG